MLLNEQLPEIQATLLNILEGLEPGVKLTGDELQKRARIKTKREFYFNINDLRMKGFPIGASKRLNGGYSIIRTEAQLKDWYDSTLKGAQREIKVAGKVLEKWYADHSNLAKP